MDKYMVFEDCSCDKYYTTNNMIIKKLKKYNKMEQIVSFITALAIMSCITSIVFIFLSNVQYRICYIVFFASLFIFLLIVSIFIDRVVDLQLNDTYELYYSTPEYKEQHEKYLRKAQSAKDKLIYEKSKNFVEMYEILLNTTISKEQKIQLIKKYILKFHI